MNAIKRFFLRQYYKTIVYNTVKDNKRHGKFMVDYKDKRGVTSPMCYINAMFYKRMYGGKIIDNF